MLFLSFKIEIKDRVVGGKYKVLEKIFEWKCRVGFIE